MALRVMGGVSKCSYKSAFASGQVHNLSAVPDSHAAIVQKVVTRLQQARVGRGLSQEALAELAGVSRGCVQHMEKGRTTPTLLSLLKIAAALETHLPTMIDESL